MERSRVDNCPSLVFCRYFFGIINSQNNEPTNAIIVIEAIHQEDVERMKLAIVELKTLIEKFSDGQIVAEGVLDSGNPAIEG
ncbi:MAG: hypothetical protein UW66_C0070G0001 [Candidatus Moranbacteria bacterium GW2011_GWF1_44_4]|nr:MAG: hypothetical protein UW66_C0070G0001 [Candidatus Moranbacteria bacterium GW2011_GWF1_44_4]